MNLSNPLARESGKRRNRNNWLKGAGEGARTQTHSFRHRRWSSTCGLTSRSGIHSFVVRKSKEQNLRVSRRSSRVVERLSHRRFHLSAITHGLFFRDRADWLKKKRLIELIEQSVRPDKTTKMISIKGGEIPEIQKLRVWLCYGQKADLVMTLQNPLQKSQPLNPTSI